MNKNEFRILFMDDELNDSFPNPATEAVKALEEKGYYIYKTTKMSEVIDQYFKNYFDLYILDIDMSKVPDEFSGTGTKVGEVLKRLNIISNVVIFSARGTVNDWIKSANYHFYAYVHKEEGIEKLLKIVEELFNNPKKIERKNIQPEEKILVYYRECNYSKERIKELFDNVLIIEKLKDFIDELNKTNPILALMIYSKLPIIPSLEEYLKKISSFQPYPHLIICLNADKEDRQILKAVNMRPFRMLNILSPDFENQLKQAVKKGITYYGDYEIFESPDNKDIIRKPVKVELTEEEVFGYDFEDNIDTLFDN